MEQHVHATIDTMTMGAVKSVKIVTIRVSHVPMLLTTHVYLVNRPIKELVLQLLVSVRVSIDSTMMALINPVSHAATPA